VLGNWNVVQYTDASVLSSRVIASISSLFVITLFYSMNVLLAVVVITLPAVLLFCTPVIIFDLLSWTKETGSWSDNSRLPQKVVSTELQSRMKSFLMRYSAADIPLDNDFVISSHLSSAQSHGSIHLTYVGDVQNVKCESAKLTTFSTLRMEMSMSGVVF